jgi:ubiquinone/menaquinone biosynthesis C-methylase UbiE
MRKLKTSSKNAEEEQFNHDMTPRSYCDDKPDEDYLERGRMYLGYDEDVLEWRSLLRYEFSRRYVKEGDICLDAACGTGYGSNLLAQTATKVIGLEISDHALKYAREHFSNEKIEFRQADLTKTFDLPDDYFDVIVSVETLEHISDHNSMMAEFQRVSKPGGTIVLTTVEHHVYSELGGIKNVHHIGELTKKELLDLISKYFKLEELYGHLKYIPPTPQKRATKKLWRIFTETFAIVDVFDLRHRLMKWSRFNRSVESFNSSLSNMVDTDLVKCEFDEENEYYQLLVVARKQTGG